MKKYGTLLFFVVFGCSMLQADVFASRTKVTNPDGSPFDGKFNDGTGAKLWYFLNDTATAVTVKVIDASAGTTVATINAGAQGVAGNPNAVIWDGTGAAAGGKYYCTITTTGPVYSNTDFKSFYFQATAPIGSIGVGIFTRGVDINTNMNTRGFGYWYASNSDAGATGYKTGMLRYNPDGSFAGTDAGHPILTQTLGTSNGGTFSWGSTAPWTSAVDSKGRIYQVSNGGGFVTRMDNDSAVPKIIIRTIASPRGIYTHGEGANLKLYIAADTVVWRANIGSDDTLATPLEMVGSFGLYVRDVILDDGGGMLVTLRSGTTGVAPGYIEKYDISSGLPKKRSDALFQIVSTTGLPVCFAKNSGPDKNSASDDTIYYSVRGANAGDSATYGIHQIVNVDGTFPDNKQIFKSGNVPGSIGGNNNANADLALDWGGNIIWFENSNEEIFMVAPPRAGTTVTRTTRAYDTVTATTSMSVRGSGTVPADFVLNQNYPNPFNPSTMVSFQLPSAGEVNVTVYDLLGNAVVELLNGEANAGYNAVAWNARNSAGMKVASGMYLYRISVQLNDGRMFSDVKRMMLLK